MSRKTPMIEQGRAPLTMTTGEWRLRLAELCRSCAEAMMDEEAILMRAGHALLASPPESEVAISDHLPPAARFDALLDVGATDSAAMSLLPENACYIISRSAEGESLASVMLPGMEEEVTSEADTPALALMSALAAAIATVSEGGGHGLPLTGMRAAGQCGRPVDDVAEWACPTGVVLH